MDAVSRSMTLLAVCIAISAAGYAVYQSTQVMPPSVEGPALDLRYSVFKIRVTSEVPDFKQPWKKRPSGSSSGSGFYIGDARIMTNAHVVANGSFITVQRDGDAKPVTARVLFVAHDADLAILTVDQPEYFDGVPAMKFGGVPGLRSPVATIGFPKGGEQISITAGVVSRVGYRTYVHPGDRSHVLIQVDSAINGGNSGGPVVQGREVVGVAFQAYTTAENTGYIIPTPVIDRFLRDIEDGRYDGHPEDGLWVSRWSTSNQSALAFHGLKTGDEGVQVSHMASWSPLVGVLDKGDILLSVDDYKIGTDGKIDFHGERVEFRTIYDLKQYGEKIRIERLRDGERKVVEAVVSPATPHYSASNTYAFRPKYLVYGGLVFTALTRSYLRSFGSKWYRQAPFLLRYLDSFNEFQDTVRGLQEMILITDRLPDDLNAYAEHAVHNLLTHVDGVPVRDLPHLAQLLEDGSEDLVLLEFYGDDLPLALDRKSLRERNVAINQRYRVQPDRWFLDIDGTANAELPGVQGH